MKEYIFISLSCGILVVLAIRTSTLFFSDIMIGGGKRKYYKIIMNVICMIFNVFQMVIIHKVLFGYWNFFRTLHNIVERKILSHQLDNIPIALLGFGIGGCTIGYILRKVYVLICGKRTWRKITKQNKQQILVNASVFALVMFCMFYYCFNTINSIDINEIYISNGNTAINDATDYIEIRNSGEFPYEFPYLFLSDDENNLQKMKIESRILYPQEVELISIDENVISLSRDGRECIILSDDKGNIIDQVYMDGVEKNQSYGLNLSTNKWEYMKPSPGKNNYGLDKPVFSADSGFYDSEFEVSIEMPEGVSVYYTTDGSVPTEDSNLYSEPILIYDKSSEPNVYRAIKSVTYDWNNEYFNWNEPPVDKGFVLRAIAIGEEKQISDVVTATYFIKQEKYKERNVVSVVVNPEDFFGEEGIYSTGKAYDEWYINGQNGEQPQTNFEIHGLECAANVELIKIGGELSLNQECGVRVQGHSQRGGRRKRLSLFSREEYSGDKNFECIIFDGRRTHSMVLREGLDNALCMELVEDRNITTQANIPVTVFLNGEYWCDTYMQEKYSDEFFEEIYGLQQVEYYKCGITEDINEFLSNNDLATEEAYEKFGEIIDIQSYIDFICSNVYVANTDYNENYDGGNVTIWRTVSLENNLYGDGKWRWALYDMDLVTETCRMELGLEDITDAEVNSFVTVRPWATPVNQRPIYSNLKKNAMFCEQFVLTFMDMVNTNFAVDEVEKKLQKYGLDISYNNYFYQNRKEYITRYLAKEFGLIGTKETITINTNIPEAGEIVVNTCKPNMLQGSWSGEYYTDYPITICAVELNGYKFKGWEGSINSSEATVEIDLQKGGVVLNAVFEKNE